jgi:GNAT superfamily N-acetyltransferase
LKDSPAHGACLRPARPEDLPFLAEVYASTRSEELALTNWTDEQKTAFCQMQFEAQHRHYQQYYSGACFDVIEWEGRPVGRLYVARWEKEIRIVDIALLPQSRGKGIGSQFLLELQEEARAAGKTLSIHVEKFNPALRLYQRLGFKPVEDKGVCLLMAC